MMPSASGTPPPHPLDGLAVQLRQPVHHLLLQLGSLVLAAIPAGNETGYQRGQAE